jgi:cell division protein FtsL
MTRLNLVLLIAVLATALYLVRTQYESRRLYVELEKAAAQSRKLESDNERLQVEKRAQATPLRVEKLAKDNLQMRTATPAITQYATDSSAPGAVASAPVPGKTGKTSGPTTGQGVGTP